MIFARLNICLLLLAYAPVALAINDVPDSVGSGLRLDNVQVTARRSSVRVSADMPVQTMTASRLAALGVSDISDAVRRFAGTNVRDYGGLGGLKTVSVRNMGACHTAVSYDGVPVSNCQGGQIDIGQFSLDNVASLSLAVGHADDLLQPARLYASAAVLGITTTRPVFTTGHTTSFKVCMRAGSWGFLSPSARLWQKMGKVVTTSLDVGYTRSVGDYAFTLTNGNLVTREKRVNSALHSWRGEANIYVAAAENHDIQVKGYIYRSRRGLPGAVKFYNPVSTQRLWDLNGFIQARYTATLSSVWRLQAVGKYTNGWNRDRETGPQFTGGVYHDTHRQQECYFSASTLFTPHNSLSFGLAQDVAHATLHSTVSDCPDPRRNTSVTALTARWHRAWLTARVTATATYISEHVSSGAVPSSFHRINPAASISVRPLASEAFFVRAMYKSTFRPPSFNDLYYERVGNRHLRPERADEFGVGLTWSRSLFPAMDYLSLTVDGYYNNVDDKIVALPTTYVWRTINFGKARVTGIDVTLATSVTLPKRIVLTLSGAYTWQRSIDQTDPLSKTYRHQLPYTPVHSGNLALTVSTPWVEVGYSAVGVGRRYFLAQNIPANEIPGYIDQTLTLSREFSVRPFRVGVRAEINNLADEQYQVIKHYPMPGRAWRATAYLKF